MERGINQIYGARDQIYGAREQLKQFLKNNDVVTTISGVTVAVAAGNMIRSFVNEIVFPIFYFVIKTKHNGEFSPIDAKNIAKFSKESLAFIFTLIATYLFVKYLLKFMFSFDGTVKDKKETNNNSQEGEGTPVSRMFKQQRGPK